MNNYDLNILSHHEFEQLTRDLLQKNFNVYIESFTTGKDSGIDLRFGFSKDKKSVVQCKRYDKFSSLLGSLKKELKSIQSLNFEYYYLATSLGLTPNQKDKIKKLLIPYITDCKNIFGKDDLNNILSLHKDVELKYYKLWLSSTTVLNRIIHSKIINASQFDKSVIQKTVKTYVQNDSFQEALKILKDQRFVIISGIPGIGKTTLSQMLVFHFLSKDYDEFISLNRSIADAFSVFHEEKKQIFFYDDFLGRNFLEDKLEKNDDALLYKFITQIKESKNKLLIMTTREYILKQAQQKYELLNKNQFDIGKFILDLSSYTKWIRAQILYNHLYFSDIADSYIENLIENNGYLKIINHENYNPRIIESILEFDRWKTINPENFTETFIQYLDNPKSVWEHAFDNQINQNSRYLLLVMLTTGTPIILEDLLNACEVFFSKNSLKYSININEGEFEKIIKEIEGSFITLKKDSKHIFAADFANPSISDFLLSYMVSRKHLITDIILSAKYVNQFFNVFTVKNEKIQNLHSKKIMLSDSDKKNVIKNLCYNLETIECSSIYMTNYVSGSNVWYKPRSGLFEKLDYITENIDSNEISIVSRIALKVEYQINKQIDSSNIEEIIKIYRKISKYIKIDTMIFLNTIVENMEWIYQVNTFSGLKNEFPDEYSHIIQTPMFVSKIKEIIDSENDNLNDDNIENLISDLEFIKKEYNIDTSSNIDSLYERIEEIRVKPIENKDSFNGFTKIIEEIKQEDLDSEIEQMFLSLQIN